jgi:UDP-3-O-[3-hydroxymyristoyl] glucosamine N-acyltransferase
VTIGNRVKFYGKSGTVQNVVIPDDVTILGSSNVGKNLEAGKTYLGSPCEESTTVAKQWAIIKQLPSLWEKLRKL